MKRLALILILLAGMARAVQPDEVLDDPMLEARARDISAGLRCPICRNESIDESHAAVARDLRLMVRERLMAGDSDDQVRAALVARYGEYILLTPQVTGSNLILWLAAPGLLVAGVGVAFAAQRRRRPATDAPLTPEEQARLDRILKS